MNMIKIGHHRLAWQKGVRGLYADITLKIEQGAEGVGTIYGIDSMNPAWRTGILFGLCLAKERLVQDVDWSRVSVTIKAFRGVPCDTTITAAAFVAFHAIAQAMDSIDIGGVFTFEETTGRFSIG